MVEMKMKHIRNVRAYKWSEIIAYYVFISCLNLNDLLLFEK